MGVESLGLAVLSRPSTLIFQLACTMIFKETKLKGAFIIELERLEDERGFFARTFCQKEFEEHGLNPCVAQCNISYNRKKGTLRGMHYQAAPYEEAKLVSCIRGAIYDVIIDLRPDSDTYCQWFAIELTSLNSQLSTLIPQPSTLISHLSSLNLYVPEGFAHGFQTLEDDTVVFYQMSEFHYPESGRGIRWDDPAFGIEWPLSVRVLSDRDKAYPDFIEV